MQTFPDRESYKEWVDSQNWYQTIELPSGVKTPGNWPTHERTPIFDEVDFQGKSVLDIGCNSGQYCFLAKDRGASEVVGIDVNKKRIEQARILAANEKYDISFFEEGIFDLDKHERRFDIVFCIAVLTEVPDIFGAIEQLKQKIGSYALIELDLAKPILYLSSSKNWLKGYKNLSRRTAVTEVRKSKMGGWVISPSFDVLCEAFGDEFKLKRKNGGVRYDMVEVFRKD